ncbi:MAG: hypothetical protein HKN56_09655 [Gammaproteobacteria bacterium]|nr:cytochrome c [Gammaproteobacteria bacterium]NND55218.1 hypothetical protein [Gammaproteobacteria bacterium]
MFRAIATSLIAIVTMFAMLAVYLQITLPRKSEAPNINFTLTPEMKERGVYLAENVLVCDDCHSQRDWGKFGGPIKKPQGAGRGCVTSEVSLTGRLRDENQFSGIAINSEDYFPEYLCVPNITPHPTGIGDWTDGELLRAVREGINIDDKAMFPIMPYHIYRDLTGLDALAVISWMRDLPPVDEVAPPRQVKFPMNVLVNRWPRPVFAVSKPLNADDEVEYGSYLSHQARCNYCHTPRWGQTLEDSPNLLMAGGVSFMIGKYAVRSTNLTPHEDGLKDWSREAFIRRFKSYEDYDSNAVNTWMNWKAYSGMTEEDLGAIYAYLQSLRPVPTPGS